MEPTSRSRAEPVVVCVGPIRASEAREDIPHRIHERAEGYPALAVAVKTQIQSERAEGILEARARGTHIDIATREHAMRKAFYEPQATQRVWT